MTVPSKLGFAPTKAQLVESAYIEGDLAKLTDEQRVGYYLDVCKSLGLNPATKPFSYITLNGKLTLYATRAAADQLRKVNGVSLEIVSRDITDNILTIHVRATLPDGRRDEDLGSISLMKAGKRLEGDDLANAELKCITKAKRRATLSICGLGWLDETEVATIPQPRKAPQPKPDVMLPPHNPDTGEIIEPGATSSPEAPAADPQLAGSPSAAGAPPPPDESQRIAMLNGKLAEAAAAGMDALRDAWGDIPAADKKTLRAALERRHKPMALNVDKERDAVQVPEEPPF